jgi:hypothetical protein
MTLMRSLTVIVGAVAVIGLGALPAAATGPVIVTEPGSLGTLTSAVVAGIIGYRFIRRR